VFLANPIDFNDKVYQLLSHGRWFSPGTSASSTTKTGRHDIAEILLKVALNTKKKSNQAEVPGENHRPCESNWYTLSLSLVARAPFFVIYKAGREPTSYW
jgi:hypothetical protein